MPGALGVDADDIVRAKVGVDENNFYFYAEAADAWTPSTDPNWALLFVNSDQDYSTGWCGFDYIVNRKVTDDSQTTLCKWNQNDGEWEEIATLQYAVEKNLLCVVVPRDAFGGTGDSVPFDFKWSDNPQELKDAISLCVAGDTAPNRRFNYRFLWKVK